eukprot:3623725-Alexandrium_andersonii.AAC.1
MVCQVCGALGVVASPVQRVACLPFASSEASFRRALPAHGAAVLDQQGAPGRALAGDGRLVAPGLPHHHSAGFARGAGPHADGGVQLAHGRLREALAEWVHVG